MPETKFQDFIYTLIMAFVMVYVMVCYNISIYTGGLNNFVFLEAFKELPFMWIVATIFINKPSLDIFISSWLQSMVLSFPMAMCFQLFYAWPIVRFIFNLIFKNKLSKQD